MFIDQGVFDTKTEICELNEAELSAINGGIVPAYLGVRIGFAVGTILLLAAIDYYNN
jgi:lactobin A/cerein 7B family class IIb bacteriocin